jgi:hypothetical protein
MKRFLGVMIVAIVLLGVQAAYPCERGNHHGGHEGHGGHGGYDDECNLDIVPDDVPAVSITGITVTVTYNGEAVDFEIAPCGILISGECRNGFDGKLPWNTGQVSVFEDHLFLVYLRDDCIRVIDWRN